MKYGIEIIKMLEECNITIDEKIKNTIELLAFDIYNKGKEKGRVAGINKACKEMEMKTSTIRING